MTGSPVFFSNLRNRRNTFNSNYDMSIKNCQAIQNSWLDRECNAWFTLGSESESMVCDTYNFLGSTAGRDLNSRVLKISRQKQGSRLTGNSQDVTIRLSPPDYSTAYSLIQILNKETCFGSIKTCQWTYIIYIS